MGSLTSFTSFVRPGKVDFNIVKYLFPLSFIGSAVGVYTVKLIPHDFLKPLVIVMLLCVTCYSLFKKQWGKNAVYRGLSVKKLFFTGCIVFFTGFYDGFFGPGTGSFMLFSLILG